MIANSTMSKKTSEMTTAQFEAYMRKNRISGMAAASASRKRRAGIKTQGWDPDALPLSTPNGIGTPAPSPDDPVLGEVRKLGATYRFYYSPKEAATMTGPFRSLSMNSPNYDRPLPEVFVNGTWLAYTSFLSGPSPYDDAVLVYQGELGRTNPENPKDGDTKVVLYTLKDHSRYASEAPIPSGTLNVFAAPPTGTGKAAVSEVVPASMRAAMENGTPPYRQAGHLLTISDGDQGTDMDRAMAVASASAIDLTPSFRSTMGIIEAVVLDATRKGRQDAIPHIRRMAALADMNNRASALIASVLEKAKNGVLDKEDIGAMEAHLEEIKKMQAK